MNKYLYSKLNHMIQNILIISIIEINVKYVFNLSNRVIIIIQNQLSSEIISDIVIYKNYLSQYKEKLNFFDNILMSLEEKKVELELDSEEVKVLSE